MNLHRGLRIGLWVAFCFGGLILAAPVVLYILIVLVGLWDTGVGLAHNALAHHHH
jgi:hypothetical protein